MSISISNFIKAIRYYYGKTLSLLKVRAAVGGMEISDSAARLAYFDGKNWKINSVRFEPGVINGGKIANHKGFVEALQALKLKTWSTRDSKKMANVVVSLGSINIYSQVFSLPIVEGENFEKAIQLNVQMVSPLEMSRVYSGWQPLSKDEDIMRLEILSAFIDRQIADELANALFDAGFLAVVLEPRSLALSRAFRDLGGGANNDRPYIAVAIDDSGIDFLIVRNNQPYFEYFNSWRDVTDEKGQVSIESFKEIITRNLHQVLNFYNQHWPDSVDEILISAAALDGEVSSVIQDNFSLSIRRFKISLSGEIGPEWYIALGCGLRGFLPRGKDHELSLLGVGAEEGYKREQLLALLHFWRLAMPLSLAILFLVFFLADIFLIQNRRDLAAQDSSFSFSGEQLKESRALQAEAADFNRVVSAISSVQKPIIRKSPVLEKLVDLAFSSGITIDEVSFSPETSQVSLRGFAGSEDKILNFKKFLEKESSFSGIDMPLTSIRHEEATVRFFVTLALIQ